jgi:hypothetical protein
LIGGGKVGEAKNFLYIIPGEDWGVGEEKNTPAKKLGYRENLSYI